MAALQQQLAALGYRTGAHDGRYGPATVSAVLAFQKREGLGRDGSAGPEVLGRIAAPQGVGPRPDGPVPRVEVDLARQVAFVVLADGGVTTINVSSGNGQTYTHPDGHTAVAITPTGDFSVQRRIDGVREAPLGSLYRPLYFRGGYAIHGSASVPAYPASHGCVRTSNADQDWLFGAVANGTAVVVYDDIGTQPTAPLEENPAA